MGTQKSCGANNNKTSYSAVLHRYIDSKEMPSRYDKEPTQQPMETLNHAKAGTNDTDRGHALIRNGSEKRSSYDFKAQPNLPGIPVPYEYHIELKPAEPHGSQMRRMRRKIFNFLEGHKTFKSNLYHHFVIFIILCSIGFAVSATIKWDNATTQHRMRLVTLGYEFFLFVIFGIEYCLRVWSCSANSSYIGTGGRLRFIRRPIMVLDAFTIVASFVLVITFGLNLDNEEYRSTLAGGKEAIPSIVRLRLMVRPICGAADRQVLRYLVLLQLLRVLRIDRHRGAFETFKCVVRNHFKELLTCWYMGFIVIIFLSYITYADPTQKSKGTVSDLANGLYWGVVSMTTIGYGDISPVTGLSKLILCIFALVGAGFIAMPAGIIGSGFALQVIEQRKLKEKTRRRRPAAELIQAAWKVYASNPAHGLEKTWQPHMNLRISLVSGRRDSVDGVQGDDWESYQIRSLAIGEKLALGFIRRLKLNVAARNFKQSTRPYDVKDILDRFAATHVEIFERLKEVKRKMVEAKESQDLMRQSKEETEVKLERIEDKVNNLTEQISDMTGLLRELVAERHTHSSSDTSYL